jgi:uncharacterized SAM-binding protein YcdF (DUF218 family)
VTAATRTGSLDGRGVTRRWLRPALAAILSATATLTIYFGAVWAADPLLTVRSAPDHADFLVVLGGDGPARAHRAAEIFSTGIAGRVLVTGDGDCDYIANEVARQGVAPQSILIECESGTTQENALFSAPILTAAGARSAILVTSWFHSLRAVETFSAALPSVDFYSIPAEPPGSPLEVALTCQGIQVLKEYPKIVLYRLRRLAAMLAGAT